MGYGSTAADAKLAILSRKSITEDTKTDILTYFVRSYAVAQDWIILQRRPEGLTK